MMRDGVIGRTYKRIGGTALCLAVILLGLSSVSWASDKNAKLHSKGKKFVRERKWGKAIETYGALLEEYPVSRYSDDAQFWIGFSWEQIPGREKKAFDNYQKVVDNHLHSSWVNDAVIHQIFLAKKLLLRGEEAFGEFLRGKAADSDSTVRYQAALALGELRDPTVLSILEEMVKGKDDEMAKLAMDVLKGYSETLEETVEKEVGTMTVEESEEEPIRETTSRIISEKLRRTGEMWTEVKLLLNGLYHIVSKEDLAFYLSLENDWDRREWWRKQWAPRDPTPTTPENEAEEEFKRRVWYAWEHFGKDWDNHRDYYPPWDSRGEVYIKFGKPDHREEGSSGWELWTYYRYRVNFLISDYLPNSYGQGVYLGRVSRFIYRRHMGWKQALFLREPQFLYVNPGFEKRKNVKDMELGVTSTGRVGSRVRVQFTYRFPAQNLRFDKEKGAYKGAYRYRWVVYDEDYRSLASSDAVDEINFTEKKDLVEKEVSGRIEVVLVPGSYILALRIEDIRSSRLGIYRKNFTVQSKGGIDSQDVKLMRK